MFDLPHRISKLWMVVQTVCVAERTNLSYWRKGFAVPGAWSQGSSPRLAQRVFFFWYRIKIIL